MTKDEALTMALEALECALSDNKPYIVKSKEAITAIKAALAQPEQEPFEYWNAVEGWVKVDEVRKHFDAVGCGTIYKTAGEDRVPVYTTPPQRQPLTHEQMANMFFNSVGKPMHSTTYEQYTLYARAIEAAHGIKGDA